MSELEQTPETAPLKAAIVERMAMPMLTFSGVLFTLLLISYVFLLPRFTQLHQQSGLSMNPRQIVAYQKQLAADLSQQEGERVRLVLPITDETYTALKQEKIGQLSLTDIREELRQAASRLGDEADAVAVSKISIDGLSVTVEGDVRNIGTRSMTVLAAFVEEVSKLSFISDLDKPSFTREQLDDGSFHSPFVLQFVINQKVSP